MKRRIERAFALTLAIILLLLSAGCASAPAEATENEWGIIFGENGYEFKAAPYGCTVEEASEGIGAVLEEFGNNPKTKPFEYMNYRTPNPDVELLGCEGKADAQFTEDGLFAFTFTTGIKSEETDEFFKTVRDQLTDAFGKPTEDYTSDTNVTYISWEDKKSGTELALQMRETHTDDGGAYTLFQVGVFEKWRYIEKGVGEWVEK